MSNLEKYWQSWAQAVAARRHCLIWYVWDSVRWLVSYFFLLLHSWPIECLLAIVLGPFLSTAFLEKKPLFANFLRMWCKRTPWLAPVLWSKRSTLPWTCLVVSCHVKKEKPKVSPVSLFVRFLISPSLRYLSLSPTIVDHVLDVMGLVDCQNTKIGDGSIDFLELLLMIICFRAVFHKGISGGQKRRVRFARCIIQCNLFNTGPVYIDAQYWMWNPLPPKNFAFGWTDKVRSLHHFF